MALLTNFEEKHQQSSPGPVKSIQRYVSQTVISPRSRQYDSQTDVYPRSRPYDSQTDIYILGLGHMTVILIYILDLGHIYDKDLGHITF